MKTVKKIVFGIFLLISLLYLFIIISPKVFKGFYPFGIKTAVVATGSMEPTLEINDFVVMKKPKSIKVNDIISFKEKNLKYEVLHRVIKIDGDEIATKGDANNVEDKPTNRNDVTGVYLCKIKYLGNIISFINKPLGVSIVCTTLFIIFIIPSKEEE